MVSRCRPPQPEPVLAVLGGIAAGAEVPGSVVSPYPESTALGEATSLQDFDNARPNPSGLRCARRGCLGDYTALPVDRSLALSLSRGRWEPLLFSSRVSAG